MGFLANAARLGLLALNFRFLSPLSFTFEFLTLWDFA